MSMFKGIRVAAIALLAPVLCLFGISSPARSQDITCRDFLTQEAAQSYFVLTGLQTLDFDGNDVACEFLPSLQTSNDFRVANGREDNYVYELWRTLSNDEIRYYLTIRELRQRVRPEGWAVTLGGFQTGSDALVFFDCIYTNRTTSTCSDLSSLSLR
jgi:hypothetical protein